jgi:nucleoside-diphosphate-sugar epimerase
LSGVVTEDRPYHAEDNPYSRTKIAGEEAIATLVRERGAPVVVVRPGWVYGPRDTANFARLVTLVESGRAFIVGTGDNVVPVVASVSRRVPFSALYLAGRTAEVIWQAAGRRRGAPPPLTTYGVTLLGGHQQFSLVRAREELGYAPEFDVGRGVGLGVRWYLETRSRRRAA